MIRPTALLLAAMLTVAAHAAYDEKADAKADVRQALTSAKAEKKPMLIIFGANWCKDCMALDQALTTPANAAVMREFKVVKVDVGDFDRNLDVVNAYGNPIKKGIPAAVVVNAADGRVLYATQGGELANARKMSDSGVQDFFKDVLAKAK
ncbi:MAG: thioredoxin family protein [Proteobacteria bacterium]|nr:thioredoxin family protein [Pseudomonadota bacterium]